MPEFRTREQCESYRLMHFEISCATCERSDEECPWLRQDEPIAMAGQPRRSNLLLDAKFPMYSCLRSLRQSSGIRNFRPWMKISVYASKA